jgi:hypothetical protein
MSPDMLSAHVPADPKLSPVCNCGWLIEVSVIVGADGGVCTTGPSLTVRGVKVTPFSVGDTAIVPATDEVVSLISEMEIVATSVATLVPNTMLRSFPALIVDE